MQQGLKEHREARGWSRAELARRARLNATTISWIESGRFRPYRVQLQKLAKALGLREEDLSLLIDRSAPKARSGR